MDDAAGSTLPGAQVEERLLRLEQEVARLQRELAGMTAQSSAARVVAPPPPPPPFETSPAATPPPTLADNDLAPAPADARPFNGPAAHVPRFGAIRRETGGSLENRLGSQWFNRIGIVLLLLGTSWFLKLAIDRGWIVPSPIARVIAGLVAGAAIVLWSERFRHKGFWAFSYSLKALGSGVLYLSLWAGFRLYGLLPAALALGLMIAVTAWNAFMAWAQDGELLAGYALAGGFATPILLSTGGNHEIFLFTYLLAIDAAAVALVRLKRWPRLLLAAFPVTVAYFIGWYLQYWAADELSVTALFIVLFGVVFGTVALGAEDSAPPNEAPAATRKLTLARILTPLANAAFVGLALYSVLQDSGHHSWLPWMVLLLAGVYLAVMRAPQTRTASAIHLSIAVVFLTVAIPLKASGHWITAGWLVEGLALVWVAARLATSASTPEPEADASRVLRWLGLAALGLGVCGIVFHLFPPEPRVALWTSDTATALVGVAVFAAAAWIALARRIEPGWREIVIAAFIAIDLVAVLLALREILFSWGADGAHAPLATGAFGSAVLALLLFAGVAAISIRESRKEPAESFWTTSAALVVVLFNLTAVLTGVREVAAIWPSIGTVGAIDADAALKQGLATSAFLMVYGAGLLAAGFWRRSAFLRWQGLALLLFTIFKTFLYDMRNLSQGYRVASFLALGALLMAISYAYQRDWLALRTADGPTAHDPAQEHTSDTKAAG